VTDGQGAWHDVNVRGRHLASIIKKCNTRFFTLMAEGNYELALSFLDRMIKAEHVLHPYVETYNGVTKFMKSARKLENTIQVPN